jgi:hypothetical protein
VRQQQDSVRMCISAVLRPDDTVLGSGLGTVFVVTYQSLLSSTIPPRQAPITSSSASAIDTSSSGLPSP